MQFITVEVFICLFDCKTLFVCVNDRTCLRMVIPAYCLYFVYLLKKVKIRMWHYLTKYEKTSTSSLKCDYISSYGQRRNISFLKTEHWYGLTFLYLFIRPENLKLKLSENLAALTFLREKVSTFAESKWYMYTLWLLITLCNMPKGLVT